MSKNSLMDFYRNVFEEYEKELSLKTVLSFIKLKASEVNPFPVLDLVDEFRARGFSEVKIKEVISDLSKRGDVYFPRCGFIKLTAKQFNDNSSKSVLNADLKQNSRVIKKSSERVRVNDNKGLKKVIEKPKILHSGVNLKQNEKNFLKLRILKQIPSFVGADMQEYGGFSVNEVVELPFKIGSLLIKRSLAVQIEPKTKLSKENKEVLVLKLVFKSKNDKKLLEWLKNYAVECKQSIEQTVLDCIHNERSALLKDYK